MKWDYDIRCQAIVIEPERMLNGLESKGTNSLATLDSIKIYMTFILGIIYLVTFPNKSRER